MIPCRNKIIFSGQPNKETISLCNQQIQEYISSHLFNNNSTYIIQSSDSKVICCLKDEIMCRDIINTFENVSIIRDSNTFHQNDDNIRNGLYEILFPILKEKRKNVLLIGGECYLFSAFCNAENIYCYSDDERIICDCLRNTRNNRNKSNNIRYIIELVDYSMWKIPNISFDLCILNVSKKGLGENLSTQVASFSWDTYYISCDRKSFEKDNLLYQSRWDFTTTLYSVSLYFLKSIFKQC